VLWWRTSSLVRHQAFPPSFSGTHDVPESECDHCTAYCYFDSVRSGREQRLNTMRLLKRSAWLMPVRFQMETSLPSTRRCVVLAGWLAALAVHLRNG
jgi:hypothetical protein